MKQESKKLRIIAFLLCTFFGGFGIHRFYVGKSRHRNPDVTHARRIRAVDINRLDYDISRSIQRQTGKRNN